MIEPKPAIDPQEKSAPLAGKSVAIVHAAWHSCGSYQLNVSQAAVYKRLGAHVISLALREWPPGGSSLQSARWRNYIENTQDMPADERFYANMPASVVLRPDFLANVYWPLIHGDHAKATAGFMRLSPIPAGLKTRKIDLIHCNHFFCVPAALNVAGAQKCPLIVETQDIQANQYALRNDGLRLLPPTATYDEMLKTELDWLRRADVLVNLNAEENAAFAKLLPDARNALVYPAIAPVPTGPGGDDIVIVASANYPNYLSVLWFLQEILPKAGAIPVKIAGNVDSELARRNPDVYQANRHLFLGRVEDIGAIYANAGLVLLPTSDGHGLSIKAVEALSCGAPLLATPQAFRGMRLDPASLANVTLRDDALSFAAALRQKFEQGPQNNPQASGVLREKSDTRRFYDAHFSEAAYARSILAIAQSLGVA